MQSHNESGSSDLYSSLFRIELLLLWLVYYIRYFSYLLLTSSDIFLESKSHSHVPWSKKIIENKSTNYGSGVNKMYFFNKQTKNAVLGVKFE